MGYDRTIYGIDNTTNWPSIKVLEREPVDKYTKFPNVNYDQIIILKDIDGYSLCEHHALPFYFKAHIGYIPDKVICGVSKLARIVDKFTGRMQLQERMTKQITDFIWEEFQPKGVIVVVEGIHMCMRMRGVKKQNSVMVTSAVRGIFAKEETAKNEFFSLLKINRL